MYALRPATTVVGMDLTSVGILAQRLGHDFTRTFADHIDTTEAAISKHDLAGGAAVVVAVVLFILVALKMAVKAVAVTLFLAAVAVAIIAVLLFTRGI